VKENKRAPWSQRGEKHKERRFGAGESEYKGGREGRNQPVKKYGGAGKRFMQSQQKTGSILGRRKSLEKRDIPKKEALEKEGQGSLDKVHK